MTRTSKLIRPALFGFCAVVILGGLVAGCNDQAKTEDSASTEAAAGQVVTGMAALPDAEADLVRQAAAIANAIEAAPQTAAQVLLDNQMTAEEFEALIYRISVDEKLAAAYAELRK